MYQPSHFVQHDRAQIAALVATYPLATLVGTQGGALAADHLPLLYDEHEGPHGTLRGHVARANALWRLCDAQPVLAIFHGAQAYVSPSWYPTKAETHKVVPTWNYAVVHAHGTLRAIDDAAWLRAFVTRLTARHEAGRPAPWAVSDAPADYIEQMLRAIVGIEIVVERIDAKWKTSQNRNAAERDGAARALAQEPSEAARTMAALIPRG